MIFAIGDATSKGQPAIVHRKPSSNGLAVEYEHSARIAHLPCRALLQSSGYMSDEANSHRRTLLAISVGLVPWENESVSEAPTQSRCHERPNDGLGAIC